jgi:putative transposase
MVTRRCSERRFFMKPDRETTNAFVYCLAFAAQRTEVEVLFYLAMSNHYHAGVRDKAGRLPEFLECFHKLFAKHQNALRGRWENFWAPEQTSVVELVREEDILDKMVYTLTNPVAAHLVSQVVHWPGASSLNAQLHDLPVRAIRPSHFFRTNGPMPDEVTLKLSLPPGIEPAERAAFLTRLREGIAEMEARAAAVRVGLGIQVLGAKGVLRQRWFDCPSTFEPRRALSPRIACKNTWARIEAVARNKAFTAAYHAAREMWLLGKDVVFPAGTYWLHRFAKLLCEPIAAAP